MELQPLGNESSCSPFCRTKLFETHKDSILSTESLAIDQVCWKFCSRHWFNSWQLAALEEKRRWAGNAKFCCLWLMIILNKTFFIDFFKKISQKRQNSQQPSFSHSLVTASCEKIPRIMFVTVGPGGQCKQAVSPLLFCYFVSKSCFMTETFLSPGHETWSCFMFHDLFRGFREIICSIMLKQILQKNLPSFF